MRTQKEIRERINLLNKEFEEEGNMGTRGNTASIKQAINLLNWVLEK